MSRLFYFLILLTIPVFSQKEETIESAGTKLHYRTFGSGKPILIIGGGPGISSDGFAGLARKLSKKNNLTIIYDQRGTGKSTMRKIDSTTITLDLMVTDIENLRKHLKVDRWIVLGHSFGGMLASYYATKHPENIEAMILSSSAGINLEFYSSYKTRLTEKLSGTQRDSLDYWNKKIKSNNSDTTAVIGRNRAIAHAYVYNKDITEGVAQGLSESDATINSLVWRNMRRIRFDCAPGLKTFARPVLILQGKNDIIDVGTAEKIHAAFSNSTLILLDKCGHYGWLDKPKKFFAAIHNFLNTL